MARAQGEPNRTSFAREWLEAPGARGLQASLRRLKSANRRLNDLETVTGRSELRSVPPHVEVDFSSDCNFRCAMCHQSKLAIRPAELGPDEVEAVIELLPYVDTVLVAGLGEPLLYEPLDEFLRFVTLFGCEAGLFTNGQLIDERMSLFEDLTSVSVSFDGATAATFERLRTGASFDRIVAAVAALRERCPGLLIGFSTVVSNANVGELDAIVAVAAQVGANEVHLSPVNHTPELELSTEQWPLFMAELARARERARAHGIRIHDNLRPAHFVAAPTRPATRAARAVPAPVLRQRRRAIEQSAARPEGSAAARGGSIWASLLRESPEAMAQRLAHAAATTEQLAAELEVDLERAGPREAPTPYCTAPWKYYFVKSDGQARLCPYADVDVGRVGLSTAPAHNGAPMKEIRESLARGSPRLAVCRTCTDDHRHFRLETVRATCATLGIELRHPTCK